jgi:hypothetical protein
MKTPNENESKRCLQIRKRNKRGEYIHPDDIRFCEKMFKDYPEWYKTTDEEVFNDTVPYGSHTRYKDVCHK